MHLGTYCLYLCFEFSCSFKDNVYYLLLIIPTCLSSLHRTPKIARYQGKDGMTCVLKVNNTDHSDELRGVTFNL